MDDTKPQNYICAAVNQGQQTPGRRRLLASALCVVCLCTAVAAVLFVRAGRELRGNAGSKTQVSLRPTLDPNEKMTAYVDPRDIAKDVRMFAELTGREPWPDKRTFSQRLDMISGGRLSRWRLLRLPPRPDSGISYHRDGGFSAVEVKEQIEKAFAERGLAALPRGSRYFELHVLGRREPRQE